MTIVIDLDPEIERLIRAKAEAKGLSLEEYLPPAIAQAVQQEEWEDNASQATISGSEATLRRLWDTPEEDAAWKDL